MRRVCYISGSRADFGLMRRTLMLAQATGQLEVCVCVTGMHLSAGFAATVRDVEDTGLPICARVPVELGPTSGAAMALAIARELTEIVGLFGRRPPDLVMIVGDRGEMLAAAIAAVHLNIPLVHIHGGERSGSIDESVRHAISKLAHYHFVATAGSRERLIRMGERPEAVFVTGAPGLDGLHQLVQRGRADLCQARGFAVNQPVAIVMYHPVVQEAADAGAQAGEVMKAVLGRGLQLLCFLPNLDAGGRLIREQMERYRGQAGVCIVTHLERTEFVSWLAAADIMVGNSSCGIIEAGSFGLPVVNVGSRQRDRERGRHVLDVSGVSAEAIGSAIDMALSQPRPGADDTYGDGRAGERMIELLTTLPLERALLSKRHAY